MYSDLKGSERCQQKTYYYYLQINFKLYYSDLTLTHSDVE